MIKVSNLSKIYRSGSSEFLALDDISFDVPSKSTMAIIGKSGSGKSTLMHIMSGLDHPSSGQIIVDNQDIFSLSENEMDNFRSSYMSFIFQSFFVEPQQTCFNNVMLPLEIARVPFSKRKDRIEQALAEVELADKTQQLAANLSGGQKQRLAVARAIVNQPKILFADEPTGNLDTKTGNKIIDLLFSLTSKYGTTIILVTHDKDLAARCHHKITLQDGKIISRKA